jgi:RHS repeat-associated protein
LHYHPDHLGTPTHVTDSTGELVALTQDFAYGSVASRRGAQPTYGFAGAEREPEVDFGLMRMGARWYAPRVGRWVSPDLLLVEIPKTGLGKPLELNINAYSSNNPTNFVDPARASTAEPGNPIDVAGRAWTSNVFDYEQAKADLSTS